MQTVLVLLLVAGAMGRAGHAADTFLDRNHVQEAVPYGTTLDDEPKAETGEKRRDRTPTTGTSVPARPSPDGAPVTRPVAPPE